MKKFRLAKLDLGAHDKLFKLKRYAEVEEETNLSLTEISRRMVNTKSFAMMEKEILDDARLKKLIRKGKSVF